jgi:hypothetical protein
MGIHSLSARNWGRVALAATLGLTLSLAMVTAGQAQAGRAAATHGIAGKKCKKHKKHKSAAAAKKHKGCKKHKLALPAPLVRASLTWGAGPEVDLHAFDASGNQAGWDNNANGGNGGVVNNIPSAHHNGDIGPAGGTESFTDDIYVLGGPANREFSYVACLYNQPGGADYSASFTGVSKSGQSTNLTLTGPNVYTLSVPGGPPVPDVAVVCGLAG